jgi:hypothetical protein
VNGEFAGRKHVEVEVDRVVIERDEGVAGGRNFMISLGMPSGPGALPVPSE